MEKQEHMFMRKIAISSYNQHLLTYPSCARRPEARALFDLFLAVQISANVLPVDDVSARHKSESELLRRFAARANVGEQNERSECSEPRRGRRRAAEERQLGVS